MLSKTTFTRIDLQLNRDSLLGKSFKITDIENSDSIYFKNEDGKEFVLQVSKEGNLQLDQFQTPDERVDYLEDLVITLMEKLNFNEVQLHEETLKRIYGDSNN